jgi:hypothetical protein
MESWKTNKCFEILSENRYPCYLIRRFIHRHKHRLNVPWYLEQYLKVKWSTDQYRSVVYIKGVSEKISKMFKITNPEFQLLCYRNFQRTHRFTVEKKHFFFSKLRNF